jgi:hypothetical protein
MQTPRSTFGTVADSDWVLRAKVTAGLDLDGVVRWWFDPARRAEFREEWEAKELQDFYWIEPDTESVRAREFGWTTPSCAVAHRLETFLPPGQLPRFGPDGFVVEGANHILIRYNSGREVKVRCTNTALFSSAGTRLATVTTTHQHHKSGGKWWERYLPPTAERSRLRQQLRKEMQRCAIALADDSDNSTR